MSNLFIIGNGFDIAHGLNTSYEDFQIFLRRSYPNAKESDIIPEYVIDHHGNECCKNEDEVVGFIKYVLSSVEGDKWSDLESSVGKIEYNNYIPEIDDYDDDNEYDKLYYTEDFSMNLVKPILELPTYFDKWVLSINTNGIILKKDFFNLINKNSDLFLSFNYTHTLEETYGIHNVCHIHGKMGEKLYFGHGVQRDYFADDNYGLVPGTEESFQQMHDALKKDTIAAFQHHSDFFANLSTLNKIDEIYSYGFSFSDVDMFYIQQIFNCINTENIIWWLNDYDDKTTRNNYMIKILKSGFKGKFGTYHIS